MTTETKEAMLTTLATMSGSLSDYDTSSGEEEDETETTTPKKSPTPPSNNPKKQKEDTTTTTPMIRSVTVRKPTTSEDAT